MINIIGKLRNVCVHSVGNKFHDDGVFLSQSNIEIDDVIRNYLSTYFLSSFKNDSFNNFYHDIDMGFNETFGVVSKIFDNPDCLHEQSINLAKHLYEKSDHPKIKGGEFYVVYFEDCEINGETVDAVGLFKSENKDTFLKVEATGDNFEIESQQGVNINKLDKGALIFNTEKENGYIVAVVDNTNKGAEAHYWVDDFLHVRQRHDEYYNTENVMNLAKNFIKEMPNEFDVSRADQVDLANRTTKFFKEKDSFDMEEFANEVIGQPEVIDSFNRYKENYAQERDIEFLDSFEINDSAVKKGVRSLKSVIKLDKNFHIYIHGDRSKIESGEDDKGKYYKVYYEQEQ